ncbi:MAG: tail protein X, partial [Candidatus Aenigmarchaeota archaeon]|nr:tail protein X [Candidatus Aenigmarchaeota archaeon]
KYITQDGDRWDLISYKVYGSPYLYPVLLLFNPQFQDVTIFKAGKEILIPELLFEDSFFEESPPWQRD